MSLSSFKREVQRTWNLLRDRSEDVLVIHHDDADGICSGAIIYEALKRKGFKAKLICIEKLYPEIIEKLHLNGGKTIFYCDIGSPHCDKISEFNKGRNLTVVLDHHDPSPSRDPMVIDLNLENFGYKGESDFSGSTCCYLFVKTVDDKMYDLSYLALTGSIEIPEGYKSLNLEVLKEALSKGVVKYEGNKLIALKHNFILQDLFKSLQVLGSVGYYQGGPKMGVELCLHGEKPHIVKFVKELEEKRKRANKRMLSELYRGGLSKGRYIQWFYAKNFFKGMGTKVVGTFCSYLSYQRRLIDPSKYLIGYMDVPREIPGLGELKSDYVKISVRVPELLRKEVEGGRYPSAVKLLMEAVKGLGFADGHAFAASGVALKSHALEVINKMDDIVEQYVMNKR